MEINEFKILFKKYLKEIDIELSDIQLSKFYYYMNDMLEWNEKINLTAITEYEDIIIKHFIDSLIIYKYLNAKKVIDIGTGAGFPGIPIKIYREDLNVVLLDSLNKRIKFLENIINKLELKEIIAIHGRAEEFGKNKDYREKFDIVTARAVANLEILSEYMLPFLKVGGIAICLKGPKFEELNNAKEIIKEMGGIIEKIDNYNLPLTNIERNIIIIKKVKPISNLYPRRNKKIKR